jgi:hypothetical protein
MPAAQYLICCSITSCLAAKKAASRWLPPPPEECAPAEPPPAEVLVVPAIEVDFEASLKRSVHGDGLRRMNLILGKDTPCRNSG